MKPFQWMHAAIADERLTWTQKLLVYALATHTMGRPGPSCEASWAQLHDWTKLSRRAIAANTRSLSNMGWIAILNMRESHGGLGPNCYLLTCPEPVDNPRPEPVDNAPPSARDAPPLVHEVHHVEHTPSARGAPPYRKKKYLEGEPAVDNHHNVHSVIAHLATKTRLP